MTQLRRALIKDVPEIWLILQDAIEQRRLDGSDQWQDGYPSEKTIKEDIDNGNAYLLKQDEMIVAYAAIIFEMDPAYTAIEGKWLSNGDCAVVHRVATARAYKGKGIATRLFSKIEELCLNKNIYSIKVDTNFDNLPMLRILEKAGYIYCGEVYFRGSPRKAFEKLLGNRLLCDPDTGVCEIPRANIEGKFTSKIKAGNKAVKIIYFTDPICSTCWGIEPQWRKFKLEYGAEVDIEYRMGGLLPDWNYNSGGISKPSDVAGHWDEVSLKYDMPIDGDIWLEDPLSSSYPPSIGFKAAQMQDAKKAIHFLRKIREMVFLQKKNIERPEHLSYAAESVGLDVATFKKDFNEEAANLFNEDLQLGRELQVRGFPTMFFVDAKGETEKVYGLKPYSVYEQALLKLHPAAEKQVYDRNWQGIFTYFPSLTAKEYTELTGMSRGEAESMLRELTRQGELSQLDTKNGSIWQKKD